MANKIVQPPNAPFDFFSQDGLRNVWTRRDSGGATSGAGLQTLFTLPMVASMLDFDGKSAWIYYYGNFNNGAGTKRLRMLIDTTEIFDTGALVSGNANYFCRVFIARRFTSNMHVRIDLFTNPFTGNLTTVNHSGKSDLITVNFNLTHNIIFQADCSVGTDVISIDGMNTNVE